MMPGNKTYIAKQETSETIQADTTAIRSTLGEFSGGGIESSVVEMLQELLTQPKVIKHIQRGVGKGITVKVQLEGFTNADKMIALVNGDVTENSRWTVSEYYLKSLSITEAVFTSTNTANLSSSACSYQIVEFC